MATRQTSFRNPTPHKLETGENAAPLEVTGHSATDKLVIIMIFNVGDYRRKICGAQLPASFFDHSNAEAVAQRSEACNAALNDMLEFMSQDGVRVGVYDATNSTKERRSHLLQKINEAKTGSKIMYIESICNDMEILENNIRVIKLNTPDYKGFDPEVAINDFRERRKQYENVYETLDESDGPYIKVHDCRKFEISSIRGYLPLKVVHFVMNLHTSPRTFYLSRHGQSEYNVLGRIGGDSSLSKAGVEYARRLAKFAKESIASVKKPDTTGDADTEDNGNDSKVEVPARLWTSTLKRTKETGQFIEHNVLDHEWDNGDLGQWVQFRPMARRNLDELYAGTCDGMTYGEIQEKMPEEFEARQADKLSYRYPRGESYMDVILRLEPLAHEMERTREPILMIAHQGIHRIIYAYFMGLNRDDAPYVSIPLNTVIKLTPHAYGCYEERFLLMDKKEMLLDGQDEPVTSMPVKGAEEVGEKSFLADDPVMNAPSC